MPEPGNFSDQLAWNVYKWEDAQSSCEEMSVAFRPCPILGFKKCIRGWWSGLGEKKKTEKAAVTIELWKRIKRKNSLHTTKGRRSLSQ